MIDALGNLAGAVTKLVISIAFHGAVIAGGIATVGIVAAVTKVVFVWGWKLVG